LLKDIKIIQELLEWISEIKSEKQIILNLLGGLAIQKQIGKELLKLQAN
jgi:hypothetical protein